MNFHGGISSGVYQTQDVRDEKVSLTLAHWEHGEMKTLIPLRFHGKSMELSES